MSNVEQMHQPWPPRPQPPQPFPPEQQIELEALRETTALQERTIRFLLANWDALLTQVNMAFSAPSTFNINAVIPAGIWLVTNPISGTTPIKVASVTIGATTIPINAPGPFVSDGASVRVTYSPSISLVRVVTTTPTAHPPGPLGAEAQQSSHP